MATMGRAQVPGAAFKFSAFKFLENKKEIFFLSQGATFYCCCHYLVSDACFSVLNTDHQVKKKNRKCYEDNIKMVDYNVSYHDNRI